MTTGNNLLLNRMFTRNTIKALIEKTTDETYLTIINKYINDFQDKTNQQLITQLYKILEKSYRNEYFYKNTLFNKLLLGVHSPKTTTVLTELPIDKSKADFILINGKATVFEIKTELDNFERIDQQIENYYKAFNNVVVVTCESNCESIINRFRDTPVGVYILTNKNRLSIKKKPVENNSYLDLSIIFKILRKSEYESILLDYYKELPTVSQFKYYSECQRLFCSMDKEIAYAYFLKKLKNRYQVEIDLYKEVPYELKFITYFLDMKPIDYSKLQKFLKTKYGG